MSLGGPSPLLFLTPTTAAKVRTRGRGKARTTAPVASAITVGASAYLELVAAVPRRLRKGGAVASALDTNTWARDVQGALTDPVLVQFLQLHQRLSEVVLRQGVQDSSSWRWCSSGRFSTASLCLRAKR
jgi:hypothetical protein